MTPDLPNLRHLRAFLEVANCHQVAAAAERVHLSQPAVTQAVAKLERRFGVRLFDRRPSGMVATGTGAVFQSRVERLLEHLRQGAREAVRLGSRRARGFDDFDRLVTVSQLRALVAMAQFRNFSLAARELGISQPSVHRAARDLERLSGETLFETTGLGINLTRSALALARHARLAFAEFEQAHTEIQEGLGHDVGWIKVGTLPLSRSFVLPTAINRLTAERPDVRVRIEDGPYDDLLHDLRHGDLDILIGALREPAPAADVVQEAMFEVPLAVVARAGHPLAGRARLSPADLAAYPWAVPRAGAPTRSAFDSYFAQAGAAPPNFIESSSLVLIRGLLLGSDRLTLIRAHQVLHEENAGELIRLPVDIPTPLRQIGITLRKGWRPTASQHRFLEVLREATALA
jgi:DNA-binding transcriptional LysR family regulator